jgi:hypothetical protein
MKNIRNFVVLLTLVGGSVAANAQTSFQGKFQLTSETRWGKAVLPAGQYSFSMDSVQSPIVIHSEDGKTAAMARPKVSNQAASGGSYITIAGAGTDRQVRSLNLPQMECSLVFKPLTERERETLSANASQTIPVQVAQK